MLILTFPVLLPPPMYIVLLQWVTDMIMIICAFLVGLWIRSMEYVYASSLLFYLSYMCFAKMIFYVDGEGQVDSVWLLGFPSCPKDLVSSIL
jgi:hypothetical protein